MRVKSDADDGFPDSGLGADLLCEHAGDVGQGETLAQPGLAVDAAVLQQSDDRPEGGRQRVAAGVDAQFAFVQQIHGKRLNLRNGVGEYEFAAVGDQAKCMLRVVRSACGVDCHTGKLATGQCLQSILEVRASEKSVNGSQVFSNDGEATLVVVDQHHLCSRDCDELHDSQGRWACSEQDNQVIGLDIGPLEHVCGSREKINERELVKIQLSRRVQVFGGNSEGGLHAAIDVESEHGEMGAAVWFPAMACGAVSTVQIRIDRTPVTGAKPFCSGPKGENFNAEGSTQNAWRL